MTTPSSRQRAKELVQQIVESHGYISPEEFQKLETLGRDFRRKMEEAYLTKDLLIGSSVITLAKNLYSSKARFVFELLQNADDNKYTRAAESHDVPYVSFRVYPHQIILKCNEDGFTKENLAAICSVGKSSKTGAQGYIGEKGIGFKSVFMVASKVHIQSGAFSFSFRHQNGDSGMGMISPIWEDTDEEFQAPMTKLTLHLHDTGDADMLEKTRESIRTQFAELQGTLLLFMKNLRMVHVSIYDDKLEETSSTTYSIEHPRPNYAVLKSVVRANGTEREDVRRFHVTTHEVTGLAKNENRTYSDAELATRAYSRSQITLAFPLSEASTPITVPRGTTQNQPADLFVFLPLRHIGFKFLIQADFVTNANREDIVGDALRNVGLLQGVADAFMKAILQFCEHDTLKFQWMRYLPDRKKSEDWDKPWSRLVGMIADRLIRTPVLFGRNRFRRRRINRLFRLTTDMLDEQGNPLFHDEDPEQIVSQCYTNNDLTPLAQYGLRYIRDPEIIELLRKDLIRGNLSRMKSAATSENWHTRAAKLLNSIFAKDTPDAHEALKRLGLCPLEVGAWVSVSTWPNNLYFPRVDEMDIPSDISLRLLSKSVVDPERLKLFENLGAKTASVSLVRKAILRSYPIEESVSTLESSKRHLEFLFSTQALATDGEPSYDVLTLYTQYGNVYNPHKRYMYVVDDDPYSPSQLSLSTGSGPHPGDGAPGLAIPLVNEKYFEDSPNDTQDGTWVNWFHDKLRVARCIELWPENDAREYLQQYRPERFLGALHRWYLLGPSPSRDVISSIRETKVLCRGNRQILLKETYFPTTDLEKRVERYVGQDVFFPWLWLDFETTPDAIPLEWRSFLACLDAARFSTDLDFALDMLKYYLDAFATTSAESKEQRLFELYDHIQEKYREHEDRRKALKKIRDAFSNRRGIYIPHSHGTYEWAFPHECVWDAPQNLRTKYALKRLYGNCFCRDGAECSHFTRFFTNTLGINKCTWETYVEELKVLKALDEDDFSDDPFSDDSNVDFDTIANIYRAIDSLWRVAIDDEDELKEAFESDALIYMPLDGRPERSAWHKASHCVWSKAAKLKGKVSLSDDYEDLEELFVGLLGVKQVDLPMAIDELNEAGSKPSTPVSEVKESIWTVNSLLSTEPSPPTPVEVLKTPIFPISRPDGDVIRGTVDTEFFIVDREPLRKLFETRVKFLDFTLEEVNRLRPFLKWVRLEDRYLSCCVKEITSFPGEGASRMSNSDSLIRNRAYPFLRVASHFNSPRSQTKRDSESLYHILRTSEMYETNGVSANLQLSQDDKLHLVESKKNHVHIDENDSGLKIYVPRNKDDQKYMINKFLPEKLFQWMMRHPVTQISGGVGKDGVGATRDILLAPCSRMAEALDDNGIATINIENIENIDENVPELESPTTPVSTEGSQLSPREAADTPLSSIESTHSGSETVIASIRTRYPSTPRIISIAESPSTPGRNTVTDRQYVVILDKVITTAGHRDFPSKGESPAAQIDYSPPNPDIVDLGLRSTSRIERQCKIGAAGELYVFELLSQLSMPEFSRHNWKSNIREYVTVHPKYADMKPWRDRETSDITYQDCEGLLTSLLVDKGYLPRDVWEGKRPYYFIEVKTTTLDCDAPFYMSKAQYQRMRDNAITANNTEKIYAIFRVYYLGQENMGLKVYIDPEALRLSGQLEFAADTWSVVPADVSQT
ncbi:hypothetical protein EKO27_g7884 [Xylaria grammica]|uniref:Sacsin/Nov domain-containing protein n=1 Tax=Xylaria grammica TaxID=363999 RepID=A0A439CZ06_9PEZI|nr:hypothetical protein EKO27_g7884 [Xylaria grammica]